MRALVVGSLVLALAIQILANEVRAQDLPDVSELEVTAGPVQINATPLALSAGDVQVVVQLIDAPLAVANGRNAKQAGGKLSPGQQRDYENQLSQRQDTVLSQIRVLGGTEIGRLTRALNAVLVAIDSSRIPAVEALPGVLKVRRIRDYRLDLSETIPYIGATAVQNAGFNGAGVRVAVLDSGIDYTHKFFGGSGTLAAYQSAYGTSTADFRNKTTDGLFPTAKVIGGFDFVGEAWPNGPRAPDPDPIDCGPSVVPCGGGHGTHVADIIAGNDGGSHKGVAPAASLYAVKVCR